VGESTKSVLCVLALIGGGVAFFAWGAAPPLNSKVVAVCSGAIAVAALGLVIWAQFRRDKVPDFLRPLVGSFFERGGLCFALRPEAKNGRCVMEVWFQNRHTEPCHGSIAIRPSIKFLLNRNQLSTLNIRVDCPAAGFGLVEIPLPVPQKYQGTIQSFDIGADVNYPSGRGQMVRFHDGTSVGSAGFDPLGPIALTLAAAATGHVLWTSPARCQVPMPEDVAEDLPDDTRIESRIVWKLGDPPPAPQADNAQAV
jgi:hypothetical protein